MLCALNFITVVADDTACIDFIKSALNCQLAEPENECYLFEKVKTYYYSWTYRKYNKTECHFSCVRFLTDKAIIAKAFEAGKDIDEKIEILR